MANAYQLGEGCDAKSALLKRLDELFIWCLRVWKRPSWSCLRTTDDVCDVYIARKMEINPTLHTIDS